MTTSDRKMGHRAGVQAQGPPISTVHRLYSGPGMPVVQGFRAMKCTRSRIRFVVSLHSWLARAWRRQDKSACWSPMSSTSASAATVSSSSR